MEENLSNSLPEIKFIFDTSRAISKGDYLEAVRLFQEGFDAMPALHKIDDKNFIMAMYLLTSTIKEKVEGISRISLQENYSINKQELTCAFCGKKQSQVKKLIAGANAFICDECIRQCNQILDDTFE